MAQPIFNTRPQPGETNFGYGLRVLPQSIINQIAAPFQPGGRLNIFNGMFDPRVPGSITHSGYGVLGQPFGLTADEAYSEVAKGLVYANAPATGAPAPKKPAGKPFSAPVKQASAPAGVTPFSAAAIGDMTAWARNRGATVTSVQRSAQHNADVGGVGNSYHKTGQAFDSTPPKGTSMGAWQAELKRRYPQYDVLNEGDHVHVEPPQGAPHIAGGPALQAFAQAAGAVGLNQPMPGFDNSGYARADQLLSQVAANQMQPFSAKYNMTPLPEVPEPTLMTTPDYSTGDAAFAAAQPKNPFGATPEEQAKGQLKMRRADYFAGMAQALGSINWSEGPGLGELFAKLGAGALMGARAGDAEVQERMDKFDAAMQQYNIASANRNDTKAREAANIANQNIQQLNQLKMDRWKMAVAEVEKYNPRVVDGVLITFDKQPDGSTVETHTPLDPARQTAALMGQANNAIASANAHNEYTWQTYRANRELAGAALPYALSDAIASNDPQGRNGVFAVGLAEAAGSLAETGRWEDVVQDTYGADRVADIKREAYAKAGLMVDKDGALAPGQKIDKDAQTVMQDYISTQLITDFTNSKQTWRLIGGETQTRDVNTNEIKEVKVRPPSSAAQSSVATTREKSRKTSVSRDAKGRVTTRESY